eukprot:CAMPEP_0175035680 /NCGR_PEP_ID=MMETSP0005-20121125/23359_1 /TAXON_ID=420556 /ORGANISM="Ochromonas sp., Strain CCMP1393" /LENGTH=501 /DNA_ID=CAMNT_0016296775 /DNA_START=968 /DNA_END=2473 /DNA_ORIENTATION=+
MSISKEEIIRETAPPNLSELVAKIERETFEAGHRATTGLTHMHCEDLPLWLEDAGVLEFMGNANNLKQMIEKISHLACDIGTEAKFHLTEDVFAGTSPCPIVRLQCLGCNSPYDNGAGHQHPTSVPVIPVDQLFSPNSRLIMNNIVHQLVCQLSLSISLLIWKTEDSRLLQLQDRFVESFIVPTTRLYENRITSLSVIIGLVDNCYRVFPVLAHKAAALLSIITARQPSKALPKLDADMLLAALYVYIGDIAKRVCNALCLVEEYFGITQLLNVLPLLYYMGEWPESAVNLKKRQFPQAVAALAINVLHSLSNMNDSNSTCPTMDAPRDLTRFQELSGAEVMVKSLYGEQGAVYMDQNPMSFVCVALMETLARWQSGCGVEVSKAPIPVKVGYEPVSASVLEYLPQFEQLAQRTPHFAFILPVVRAFSSDSVVKQPDSSQGLLRGPLLHASMKCAYPPCSVYENLKSCSGHCKGLARYCCKEHQKLDWGQHKTFCNRMENT